MKKFKIFLSVLVLIVGCAFCFCSCSCSNKKPSNQENPASTPGSGGGADIPDTFTVTVSVNDNAGGSYLSSTGSDTHSEKSSPVYTFTPNVGYGIETITLDGAIYFTYETGGYKTEPMSLTLESISSNHVISVVFYQMNFIVDFNIDSSGFSVYDGGGVASSNSSLQHKGGTSPMYTIRPKTGHCVYWIKIDGVEFFNYYDDPIRATKKFEISEPFENISANHLIEVSFYEIADLTTSLHSGYCYTSDKNSDMLTETVTDKENNAVFVSIQDSGFVIPNGTEQKVLLDVNSNFTLESFDITLDGENYTGKISATTNYTGEGFRYDAEEHALYFDALTNRVHINTYARSNPIQVVVYNYDTNETSFISGYSLYSYYIIDSALKDIYWYYAPSSSFKQANVYRPLEVTSTVVGPKTFYHFLLDANLVCTELDDIITQDSIILIRSTTNLSE